MESERKSKAVAQGFLFLSSQDRKHQTSSGHFEHSLYLSFWGSNPKSAACTCSHTLSFSSRCQGAEGEVLMGFECQQPLGLPQAHPLHSHQVSLPDTPDLSLHRLFLRVKQSLLKADGILLGLCFITQTQCCFTPMVGAYHPSLPVGKCQVPQICVLADDSLTLSWLRESSRNVSVHTCGNSCLPGFQLKIGDRLRNQKGSPASSRPAEGKAARWKRIPTYPFSQSIWGFPHDFSFHLVTLGASEEVTPGSTFLFR